MHTSLANKFILILKFTGLQFRLVRAEPNLVPCKTEPDKLSPKLYIVYDV